MELARLIAATTTSKYNITILYIIHFRFNTTTIGVNFIGIGIHVRIIDTTTVI